MALFFALLPQLGPQAPNAPRHDPAPDPGPADAGLLFEDPFVAIDDAAYDAGTWTLGLTQLDPRQLRVRDAALQLRLQHRDGAWMGGELYLRDAFSSGRFEASVQVPNVPGAVCAFFLYGTDSEGRAHEIDVELLSARPGEVWLGTYAAWRPEDGYGDGPTRASFVYAPAGFDHRAWHRYAIDWRADRVTFYVDEVEAGAVTISPTAPIAPRFNFWTTNTWAEVAGPPRSDATCRVDDLRIYP